MPWGIPLKIYINLIVYAREMSSPTSCCKNREQWPWFLCIYCAAVAVWCLGQCSKADTGVSFSDLYIFIYKVSSGAHMHLILACPKKKLIFNIEKFELRA